MADALVEYHENNNISKYLVGEWDNGMDHLGTGCITGRVLRVNIFCHCF